MQKIYFFETPGDFNVELILVKKNNAWVAMIDTFRFIQNGITLCAKTFNIDVKAEKLSKKWANFILDNAYKINVSGFKNMSLAKYFRTKQKEDIFSELYVLLNFITDREVKLCYKANKRQVDVVMEKKCTSFTNEKDQKEIVYNEYRYPQLYIKEVKEIIVNSVLNRYLCFREDKWLPEVGVPF